MKYYQLAAIALSLVTFTAFCDDKINPKDQKDIVGYGVGLDIGRNIKKSELDVNPEAVAAGIRDGLTGAKPKLTDEQIQQAMQAVQQEMMKKQMAKAEEEKAKSAVEGAKNKKDGEAFLAANKKKDGVVTLPSGLQYKVVTAGKGAKPTATSVVKTHYRGTLIDGTEFDSSYKRGEPVKFPVNRVIKGWTEALQLMPVGSKWQLFIPSELAYGEQGAGETIGPNSTLIFDVELLGIEPQ